MQNKKPNKIQLIVFQNCYLQKLSKRIILKLIELLLSQELLKIISYIWDALNKFYLKLASKQIQIWNTDIIIYEQSKHIKLQRVLLHIYLKIFQ